MVKRIFSCLLNTAKSSRDVAQMAASAFHSRGAADMKDIAPSALCLVLGKSKFSVTEDRRL